jgi:hypothetical protein
LARADRMDAAYSLGVSAHPSAACERVYPTCHPRQRAAVSRMARDRLAAVLVTVATYAI